VIGCVCGCTSGDVSEGSVLHEAKVEGHRFVITGVLEVGRG
jgi:hypothetical protein